MEDIERIKNRLDNIEGVAPILTALRNIAAGSWRLARTRLEASRAFTEELSNIARSVQPLVEGVARAPEGQEEKPHPNTGMLVIASERGLCGAFNSVLAAAAERYMEDYRAQGHQLQIMTLGARVTRHFRRQGADLLWSESLPVTTIPSLGFVQQILGNLNQQLEAGRLDRVYAVYTPYDPHAAAKPALGQVLPIVFQTPESEIETAEWSEPLLDVRPEIIYERVQRQWALVNLYRIIMESAASEQFARYRVLEGASSNCDRLIEELTQSYHVARQHAITMEMLDLVGGAGLLKPAEGQGHSEDE